MLPNLTGGHKSLPLKETYTPAELRRREPKISHKNQLHTKHTSRFIKDIPALGYKSSDLVFPPTLGNTRSGPQEGATDDVLGLREQIFGSSFLLCRL